MLEIAGDGFLTVYRWMMEHLFCYKYYIFADYYLFSAKESHDCMGVAFAAVFCPYSGIRVISAPGSEFPQRADVQDEGDRRRDQVRCTPAGRIDLPEEIKTSGSGTGAVQKTDLVQSERRGSCSDG